LSDLHAFADVSSGAIFARERRYHADWWFRRCAVTNGKILILEDDPFIAAMYARALRRDGNDVTVYTTFKEAREHLKRDQPDALVTDVRVGEYNGLQLAWLFRTSSPDGRLVVVTGYDDPVIRREVGDLLGDFLLKPVEMNRLKAAIRGEAPLDRIDEVFPAGKRVSAHLR
jgi:DNA-binding response OmpR family regulator